MSDDRDRESPRRTFLKTSALAAGALTLPRVAAGQSGRSPSGRIGIAVVGAGGMGEYAVAQAAQERFVAICDVDDQRACKAYEAHPAVPRFKDFRVMLDKLHKEIDAVAISTPDHTHFPIAMAAMELGKHVFVQKPLAHDIWQVRTLRKAARHYGVVTQMGNQGHTFEGMRRIKEWVDAGVVGDVREVVTWTNRPNPPGSFRPRASRRRRAARRATSTGTCGRAPCPRASTRERTSRSSGAAGGTTAAARSATSAATPSTPRSGPSTWARRPGCRPSATRRRATDSSQ
jgi:hypothetical protein